MKKVDYDERDGMPVEVATQLLLKGRLPSRMRKECVRARERTITSPTPIRKAGDGEYVTDEKQVKVTELNFRKLTLKQLISKAGRSFARRMVLQKSFLEAEEAYKKMQAETDKESVVRNAPRYHFTARLLTQLADEVNRLDNIVDVAQAEINSRCLNINDPEWRKKWLRKSNS